MRKEIPKEMILKEIRRTSEANGGKPLGRKRFEADTGIKESDWLGKYWARWNDAVSEAGLTPNSMNQARPLPVVLSAIAMLAIELGRFPTQPEMRLKRARCRSFPCPDSIWKRFRNKNNILTLVTDFCRSRPELQEALLICEQETQPAQLDSGDSGLRDGHVYLLKHGNEYKIGKSTDVTRRYREIAVQMPHETEEIHVIETDDIVGIDAYWHHRFRNKRLNGEWLNLSPQDVSAFKGRRKM